MLHRLGRRVALLLGIVTGLAAAAVVTAIVALHVPRTQAWLLQRIAVAVGEATGAHLEVGRLRGDLVRHVVVEDAALRYPSGARARVDRIRVTWSLAALLLGEIVVHEIDVDGVRARAVHRADGWGIAPPARRHEPQPAGTSPPPTVRVERVQVRDARVAVRLADATPVRTVALDGIAVDAAVRLGRDGLGVHLARLAATPRGVALAPLVATGDVTRTNDGVFGVEALRVGTPRSQVSLDGTLDPGRHARLRAALGPLSVRDVRRLVPSLGLRGDVGLVAVLRGPWNALRLVATLEVVGGGRVAVRAAADAAAARPTWLVRARLDDVAPAAAWTGAPDAHLHGVAVARGSGIDRTAEVAYRVTLSPSEVLGRPLERARIAGTMHRQRHVATASATTGAGIATVRAAAVLRPQLAWRAGARVAARDLAALLPAAPGTLAARARARGRGTDPATRTAAARVVLAPSTVHGVALRRGRVDVAVDGQQVALRRAELIGVDVGRVDAWGTVDLAGPADLTLTAALDAGALRPPPVTDLAGRVGMRAALRGPLHAATLDAGVVVDQPRAATASAVRLAVVARADGLGGTTPSAWLGLDATALRLGDRAPWQGRGDVRWRRSGDADDVRVDLRGSAAQGGLLEAGTSLWRDAARTTASVDRLSFAPPGSPRWDLVAPSVLALDEGGVRTDGLALASGGGRVALAGRVAMHGAVGASLTADGIDVAPFCRLASDKSCAGRLRAAVRLAGTAAAPVIDVTARIADLAVEEATYGAVGAEAHYAARSLAARAQLDYPRAGRLDATAAVPIDLAWEGPRADLSHEPLEATLRTDRLDLRFVPALVPAVVRELDGTLTADVAVRGPRDALRATGTAQLTASRMLLPATGVRYEDVAVALRADPEAITITTLGLRAGSGRLSGGGRVTLANGVPDALDLRLDLDDFLAVQQPAYEAEMDGAITVGGRLAAPRIAGHLAVSRALVKPSLLPQGGGSTQPDPTITVVGVAAEAGPPPSAAPPIADVVAVSLTIEIARNAWIRRSDASIELGGSLTVEKAPNGPPIVSGVVRLVRGWYLFQGKRFTLDEGTITFSGSTPPDPALEITALYRTGEYRIRIDIGGTASAPKLTMSSEPSLEQADILSVLLFGKPAGELGSGESMNLQRQALSLATGYVMPELRSSVMDTLGLDAFELGPEAVRAGRYITQDVFVSLSSEFGTSRQSGQQVGIEYSLGRNTSVKASTSSRGTSSIDLQWHRRY